MRGSSCAGRSSAKKHGVQPKTCNLKSHPASTSQDCWRGMRGGDRRRMTCRVLRRLTKNGSERQGMSNATFSEDDMTVPKRGRPALAHSCISGPSLHRLFGRDDPAADRDPASLAIQHGRWSAGLCRSCQFPGSVRRRALGGRFLAGAEEQFRLLRHPHAGAEPARHRACRDAVDPQAQACHLLSHGDLPADDPVLRHRRFHLEADPLADLGHYAVLHGSRRSEVPVRPLARQARIGADHGFADFRLAECRHPDDADLCGPAQHSRRSDRGSRVRWHYRLEPVLEDQAAPRSCRPSAWSRS